MESLSILLLYLRFSAHMKKAASKVLNSSIIGSLDVQRQKKIGYKRLKYIFIFHFSVVLCYSIFSTLLTVFLIRHGGCSIADQMTGCYLTNLPSQFMQGMADFKPDFASSHFFSRLTFVLSSFLLCKVEPELNCGLDVYFDCPCIIERVELNLAAWALLELLEKLHIVFLRLDGVISIEWLELTSI